MKYKYIFGPVPSRRLGISLGIDLIPYKICSFDCIYCECGKTTLKTIKTQNFVDYNIIIEELKDFLNNNEMPDYITFSGNGEPLLYADIHRIISFIKHIKNAKMALITNSSMLVQYNILDAIKDCDIILPSLDAATQETFEKIDRPFKGLKITDIIESLKSLKDIMKGKMFLEIFFIPNYNDNEKDLLALKKAIHYIKPDLVQLNTLDRPGTQKNLKPMTKKQLLKISAFFEYKTEIISKYRSRREIFNYNSDFESFLLNTLKRRPLTIEDIIHITQKDRIEILKYLDILLKENLIKSYIKERGIFYITKNFKEDK